MKTDRSFGRAFFVLAAVALFLAGCRNVSPVPTLIPPTIENTPPLASAVVPTATAEALPSVIAPALTATPTSEFVEMLPPTPEPFCTPGASSMVVKASYSKGSGSVLVEVSGLDPGEQVYMEIWCSGSKGSKFTAYSISLRGDQNGRASYTQGMWHTLLAEKPVECHVYVIRSSRDIACTKIRIER